VRLQVPVRSIERLPDAADVGGSVGHPRCSVIGGLSLTDCGSRHQNGDQPGGGDRESRASKALVHVKRLHKYSGILGRRALPAGRVAALGTTMNLHHGLLTYREGFVAVRDAASFSMARLPAS
jgi:hypothetical protein